MSRLSGKHKWLIVLLAGLMGLLFIGKAMAAEIAGGEVYRLPAGEVIEDDLYVGAREIYIDGTVQGDLIAAGSYVEINGTVTGDAMIAGAGINLTGQVEDDVRVAGAGIDVFGSIGDDLIAAGGGGGFAFPIQLEGRSVVQGVRLADSAQVGGDVMIGGGEGTIAGTIGGDLQAGMGEIILVGQVDGAAKLDGGTIQVDDTAQVAGVLEYSSDEQISVPAGVAADVKYVAPPQDAPQPSPINVFLGWLVRTVLILVGFALLAWLVLRFAPNLLTRPANAIAARPVQAGLYGLLAAALFIFIPLASVLLVLLMVLFWGWFPGLVLGFFLFGALALVWFLSPLVTGLWLGQRLSAALGRVPNNLLAMVMGVLLLALLGRIPILGWLVYLVSFLFALGGLILSRRPDDNETLRATSESRVSGTALPVGAER